MEEKAKILIVDDDESICKTMNLIFEAKGYDIETVNTGQEAIAAAQRSPYNLAILDIRLPDMDGVDLFTRLFEMNADLEIIMITGYASIETAVDAMNKGAAAYITKPLNMDEVLATVNRALEKQQLTREKLRADAALQESEEKYRTILENIEEGYYEVDLSGNFTFFNKSLCELLGRSEDELMGMNYRQYMDRETAEGVFKTFNAVYRTGKPTKAFDWTIVRTDGIRRSIEASISLVVDSASEPAGFRGIARDVTGRQEAQEALKDSEERYRTLLQSMHDLVFVYDVHDRYVQYYTSSKGLLFVPPEEFMGQHVRDVLPLDVAEQYLKSMRRVRTSGESETFDYALEIRGQEHWFSNTMSMHEDGESIVSVVRDITNRKQVEEALRESEERLRQVIDLSPLQTFVKDSEGRFILLNKAVAESYGATVNALLGRKQSDVHPDPRQVETFLQEDAEVLGTGKQRRTLDEPFTYFDGTVHWLDTRKIPIQFGDHGTCVLGVALDITERKRAQRAVEERMKELTCLLSTSQLASKSELAVDAFLKGVAEILPLAWPHAKITYARILLDGIVFTTSNFKETKWKQVADINVGKERRGAVEVYYGEQKPEIDEGPFLKEERVLIDGVAEQIGNAIGRWQAEEALRQLTEELEQRVEKRTQELEAANQELEAFAYSVSHDLRAPLRGIDGFSMAVLEDYSEVLDEKGRDYLRRMHEAAVRMSKLIDDILSLSRVSRGKMHSEEIDMTALARTIAEELRSQEPGRKAKLVISDNLVAYGDERLMYLVLENLLRNAWKFTSKHRSARIEFGATEQENETVFFVRDNGVGFDMKYVDKLFNVFQRLHHADEFEGTGIGLAIVKRIISRHGGRTWAEGDVGKGATFHFTLPSEEGEEKT